MRTNYYHVSFLSRPCCSLFGRMLLSSTLFLLLMASSTTCFTAPPSPRRPQFFFFGVGRRQQQGPHDHVEMLLCKKSNHIMKEEHVEATTKVIEDLSNISSTSKNGGRSVTRKITTTTLAGFLALFAATGSTTPLCGDTMSANAMTVRDKDVLDKGQTIFQSTCAACHKGGSNVIAKERTLTKEALTKFLGPLEGGPEDISTFVQNSNVHRGALVFSGRLTAEDYSNVAAYVYDQAMENKW